MHLSPVLTLVVLLEQDLTATEEEINNNITHIIDDNEIPFGFIVKNTTMSDKNNKPNKAFIAEVLIIIFGYTFKSK